MKQFTCSLCSIFTELTYCMVELLFYLTLNVWATLLADIPALTRPLLVLLISCQTALSSNFLLISCQTALSSNIPSSPAYGVFISQLIRYTRACSSYEMFYSEGDATFQKASRAGIYQGTFEIVYKEVLWSVRGSYQTI